MAEKKRMWKAYCFPLILLCSIAFGCILGTAMGKDAVKLKPLGDLFINAMFMVVVPLVFTTICSAVANMSTVERLGKVLRRLVLVFVVTGGIAACVMLFTVIFFPPASEFSATLQAPGKIQAFSTPDAIVQAVTTNDFVNMLSRRAMLPLIIFTILFGICLNSLGERGKKIGAGIAVLADAMLKMVDYLMYYAPIGLCAYFAALVGDYGSQLLGAYFHAMIGFHIATFAYFFIAFTIYAWYATNGKGVAVFWKNILAPAAMALCSGSSNATLPINIEAARNMGIPDDISGIVLPIGATVHMEGSCLGGILKIAVLFGIYGIPFAGIKTMLVATAVSILCGVVLSGVPGGGFIGEALIVSMYGFPPEAFPIVATISMLIDPAATMVNAAGDTCSALIISKFVEGRDWFEKAMEARV